MSDYTPGEVFEHVDTAMRIKITKAYPLEYRVIDRGLSSLPASRPKDAIENWPKTFRMIHPASVLERYFLVS